MSVSSTTDTVMAEHHSPHLSFNVTHLHGHTLTVQSSAPLTMYCGPRLEGKQLFTKEVCPFNFFNLAPVSKSHIPKVLSVEAVNMVLKNKNK